MMNSGNTIAPPPLAGNDTGFGPPATPQPPPMDEFALRFEGNRQNRSGPTPPLQLPPTAGNDTGISRPRPQPDTRQDYLMRQAARILSKGGTQADVVKYWQDVEGVKFKNEPQPLNPKGQGAGFVAAAGDMGGMTMKAIQGLTFGLGDEAIGSLLGLLTGEGASKGIDVYRSALDAQQKQNPIGSTVAELAGSAAGGAAAGSALGLTAKAAQMGAMGRLGLIGAEGGVSGFVAGGGNATGPMSDRTKAALLGGMFGALLTTGTAGSASAAGTVLKPVVRGLTNWSETLQQALPGNVSAVATARQHLAEALARDGLTIDQAIAKAEKMAATGAPVTAADIGGENTLGLFQAATSLRGPAKQRLTEEFLNRQGEQGQRLLGSLFRSLRIGVANAYDATDDIMAERAAAAMPKYQQAYTQEVRVTPILRSLLQNPRFKQAWEVGRQIAADRDVAGLDGKALPVPTLESGPGNIVLAMAQGNDKPQIRSTLPLRGLDYMKRGLDAVIEADIQGGKMDRLHAPALRKMLNTVLDQVGEQVPVYSQARSIWKGSSEGLDALQLGKGGSTLVAGKTVTGPTFHTKPPEVIKRELASLSPGEQELYRAGAFQDMAEWVHSQTSDAPNTAAKMFGGRVFGSSQKMMEDRIRALVMNPDVAQQLVDHTMAEARMSMTTGKLGGSRTAPLQSEMDGLMGGTVDRMMGGGIGTVTRLARAAGNRARTGWTLAISDELSNLLTKGLNGSTELTAMLSTLRGANLVHRPAIAITAGHRVGAVQLR